MYLFLVMFRRIRLRCLYFTPEQLNLSKGKNLVAKLNLMIPIETNLQRTVDSCDLETNKRHHLTSGGSLISMMTMFEIGAFRILFHTPVKIRHIFSSPPIRMKIFDLAPQELY